MNIFLAFAEENRDFAMKIKYNLSEAFKKTGLTPEIDSWDGLLKPGQTILERLLDISRETDFAIFIFHPNDILTTKGETRSATRDNIIFEYGLFVSSISTERCFVLRPREFDPAMQMPSDLSNVIYIPYDNGPVDKIDLYKPVLDMKTRIAELGTRKGPYATPLDIQKIFATIGLTNVYPQRDDANNDILRDIGIVEHSVEMYSRVYISSLIKSSSLDDAILSAIRKLPDGSSILIRHISTDYTLSKLTDQLHKLEDPNKARWEGKIKAYISHLEGSTKLFTQRYASTKKLFENDEVLRKKGYKVIFRRQYLNNIMPYSLIILDKKIIYVSFYSLSKSDYGTHAPTMRLEKKDNDSWANLFLQEAFKIDNNYISRDQGDQIIMNS